MPDIVIHALVSAAYLALAWHFWNTRWRRRAAPERPGLAPWERAAILLPLALHGWLLYDGIFSRELRFGFAQALSVMMFLGVALYWVESLFASLEGLEPLILPLAAVAAPLPALFAGRSIALQSAEFKLHLALAMVAYGLFTIALLHAMLMALVERHLHRKSAAFVAHLPPLLTLERSLFRMIGVAFVFLTLTLATGMVLTDALFGRLMRFNHEAVFAVLSWLTFGWLLAGRWRYGWRGRTALRWTIAGFVMVLLANVGTAFVVEVILKRA
ncbi:MAG TPA: cytochrome c biogenesis protein CcsA [Burkholderiales bacterium]